MLSLHQMCNSKTIQLSILSVLLLGACAPSTETILPSLTFDQYARAPIYVGSLSYTDALLPASDNDYEGRLRDGVNAYFLSRFQTDPARLSKFHVTAESVSVTHDYLKNEKHKYDLLSPWKSYDQYVFDTTLVLNMECGQNGVSDRISLAKKTSVPSHYSPYERDLHLTTFTEKYVVDVDLAVKATVNQGC